MKRKAMAITLLFLVSISLLTPLSLVNGQLGINIYLVTPNRGVAGQLVNVQGTIDTTNGTYEVYFAGKLVATSKSEGFYVNANFTVPELPASDYPITLRDVSRKVNATKSFTAVLSYNIAAIVPPAPVQLQEGTSVILNVSITGAKSGATYYANITVELPEPLKTEYFTLVTLPASQTGTARTEVTFPSSEFQPSGSLTNFTGSYLVYFNKTALLANSQFFVGFTDASLYHRGDLVTIRAIGYGANQPATIKITNQKTGVDIYSARVATSSEGTVNASWIISNNALLGLHEVTITCEGSPKAIVDSQTFNVPGYPVQIRALNLASAPAPSLLIEAIDQNTGEPYTGISGYDGIATINLEKGKVNVTAYWNEVKVGAILLTISQEGTHDIVCSLTNLKIIVKDKNGLFIPFVSLNVTYSYTTTKQGSLQEASVSGQTNISGVFILDSVLSGIDYKISASLYRTIFNPDNNTYRNIPAIPTHEIVILLPNRSLKLTILDYNLKGLPNARVALSEQTSGIFYANSTNAAGFVSVEVGFGKYWLRVYKDNLLLNETVIDVLSDKETEVRCILYNLRVSVLTVDYFGQPIPNINVGFKGPDQVWRSNTTLEDGTATFGNVIGGDAQIVAYPVGTESYEAIRLNVNTPTAIQIKLGKFVLLGSFLVETNLFFTLIVIFVIIVGLALLEFFRRRKQKIANSKSKAAAILK